MTATQSLRPCAALIWSLALCLLCLYGPASRAQTGPAAQAGPEELRELVELEAEHLHAEASELFQQILEQAGDFGGAGGVAWELSEHLEPKAEALREPIYEALAPAFGDAVRAFWRSPTGERLRWLRREAASRSGRRGLARSARHIAERTPPERLERLRAIDQATFETQSSIDIGETLLGLVHAIADRVAAANPEDAEWSESPAEIRSFLAGQHRDLQFRAFVYLSNRLEVAELGQIQDFAASDAGRIFFEARRAARQAAADAIVEAMLPKLQERLDDELWEYERELRAEGEDEDEEDGP